MTCRNLMCVFKSSQGCLFLWLWKHTVVNRNEDLCQISEYFTEEELESTVHFNAQLNQRFPSLACALVERGGKGPGIRMDWNQTQQLASGWLSAAVHGDPVQ